MILASIAIPFLKHLLHLWLQNGDFLIYLLTGVLLKRRTFFSLHLPFPFGDTLWTNEFLWSVVLQFIIIILVLDAHINPNMVPSSCFFFFFGVLLMCLCQFFGVSLFSGETRCPLLYCFAFLFLKVGLFPFNRNSVQKSSFGC